MKSRDVEKIQRINKTKNHLLQVLKDKNINEQGKYVHFMDTFKEIKDNMKYLQQLLEDTTLSVDDQEEIGDIINEYKGIIDEYKENVLETGKGKEDDIVETISVDTADNVPSVTFEEIYALVDDDTVLDLFGTSEQPHSGLVFFESPNDAVKHLNNIAAESPDKAVTMSLYRMQKVNLKKQLTFSINNE